MPVDRYRANTLRDRVRRDSHNDEESTALLLSSRVSNEVLNVEHRTLVNALLVRLGKAHEKEPERWRSQISKWTAISEFLKSGSAKYLFPKQIEYAQKINALLANYEAGKLGEFKPDGRAPRSVFTCRLRRPPIAPFLNDPKLLPKAPPKRVT